MFKKYFKASSQLEEIGVKVNQAYNQGKYNNSLAEKSKMILVISCFHDLYKLKENDVHDSYYIGNLIPTGHIEGRIEEVIGTVDQAVERTIKFIQQSDLLYAS